VLGEIEITARRNPTPPADPTSNCHCDMATYKVSTRVPGSALCLLLQPRWCWWPQTSEVPGCEALSFSSSSPTSAAQVLSSEHPLVGMHHTRREVHLRDFGHLWLTVQQRVALPRLLLCSTVGAAPYSSWI